LLSRDQPHQMRRNEANEADASCGDHRGGGQRGRSRRTTLFRAGDSATPKDWDSISPRASTFKVRAPAMASPTDRQ